MICLNSVLVFSNTILNVNYVKFLLERAKIEQAPQHPESMEAIRHLEDHEKYQRQESIDETISYQMPVFIRPLQSLENLMEGGFAHFEAQITPVSDPTMKVEWLFNGQPLTAGRFLSLYFCENYNFILFYNIRAFSR